MKLYVAIFVLLSVVLFSCKKEYTQREKDRIEVLTANNVYKYKVPNDAFVFCLDTIKADEEYSKLADEYCRRGQEVDSYLYLSSYKVYLPIRPRYLCDEGYWFCERGREILTFIVNKDRKWLIEDELYLNLNQSIVDSATEAYYSELKVLKRTQWSLISFEGQAIKNNIERDSLYMSFLSAYYKFIKKEKESSEKKIDSLQKEFPFNLAIGNRDVVLPPPPISKEKIIID